MDKPIIGVFFKKESFPPLLRSGIRVKIYQFNNNSTINKISQLILKKVKEEKHKICMLGAV